MFWYSKFPLPPVSVFRKSFMVSIIIQPIQYFNYFIFYFRIVVIFCIWCYISYCNIFKFFVTSHYMNTVWHIFISCKHKLSVFISVYFSIRSVCLFLVYRTYLFKFPAVHLKYFRFFRNIWKKFFPFFPDFLYISFFCFIHLYFFLLFSSCFFFLRERSYC